MSMLKSGLSSFDTSGRKHLNLQISHWQKLQTTVEELVHNSARSYPALGQALLLLKGGMTTRHKSSLTPGAMSTQHASRVWKPSHVRKEFAAMWDRGLLTLIQLSEKGEHARQAMVRRPERKLCGLAAERHLERLDPVYASAINLLNDKSKVTYIKFSHIFIAELFVAE